MRSVSASPSFSFSTWEGCRLCPRLWPAGPDHVFYDSSAFGSRQRREFRQSSGNSFTKVAVLYTSVKESRKVKLRRNIGVKMAGSPHCVA